MIWKRFLLKEFDLLLKEYFITPYNILIKLRYSYDKKINQIYKRFRRQDIYMILNEYYVNTSVISLRIIKILT